MPELLIISTDNKRRFQLEAIAQEAGLRYKSAVDVATALEWLALWRIDGVLLDASIKIEDQMRLADRLWRERPAAPFLVVDSEARLGNRRLEERLFGAELFEGGHAFERARDMLIQLASHLGGHEDQLSALVVDDLDSPREIICTYLESFGVTKVAGARSVREAMEKLTAAPGDWSCIVTDLKMPDLSGSALIEKVRQDPRLQHLPIIVLTAYGSADHLLECLRNGASGFLVKPPKRSDFLREIGRAFRINQRTLSPRLASPDEVDELREVLERKGMI